MRRTTRLALATAVVLATPAGHARAQYYGYGWGGWGGASTVQGSIARGLGFYAMGAGQYNLETAQARAINSTTMARWNQYMYLSQLEANRREYLRRARLQQLDSSSGEAIYKRPRDNPTLGDISSGDALNVVLDQITDPRVHTSALRMATAPLSGASVAAIPFFHATDAVTINLHQLTAKDDWPLALRGENFAAERAAYQDAIAQALREDEKGDLSPGTIEKVRDAASRIRAKYEAAPPKDRSQAVEAENYIKALVGMSRMLEKPSVDRILSELQMIKTTSLGKLLEFMHLYDLRFGVANTPEAKQVYQQLYPMMVAQRDRVLKDAGLAVDQLGGGAGGHPAEFFQGMSMNQAEGKPDPNAGNQP